MTPVVAWACARASDGAARRLATMATAEKTERRRESMARESLSTNRRGMGPAAIWGNGDSLPRPAGGRKESGVWRVTDRRQPYIEVAFPACPRLIRRTSESHD